MHCVKNFMRRLGLKIEIGRRDCGTDCLVQRWNDTENDRLGAVLQVKSCLICGNLHFISDN